MNSIITLCLAFLLCIANASAQNVDSLTSRVEMLIDKIKELGYFLDATNKLPPHLFSNLNANQYYYFPIENSSKEIYNYTKDSLFSSTIDPSIFALSIDPLAEQFPSESPYCAMGNDPINMIDPDGRGVASLIVKTYLNTENTNLLIHEPIVYGSHPGATEGDLSADGTSVFIGHWDNGAWVKVPTAEELHDFRLKMARGIVAARTKGATHSANNLKRWLDGGTTIYEEDPNWLMKNDKVRSAMGDNLVRFVLSPKNNGGSVTHYMEMTEGQSVTVNDYWDKLVDNYELLFSKSIDDYYYSWGNFTITTQGNLTIKREGGYLSITGKLTHTFKDRYDWNLTNGVCIPTDNGCEKIDDTSLRLFEILTPAQSYDGHASWQEDINLRVPYNDEVWKSAKDVYLQK